MKFLVGILSGSSFEIEVDLTDTLLVVKQMTVVSSNKNQMLHRQTEQSPASNSVKETVNIQDSYVKVGGKNPTDVVKKLREEIVQRGDIQKLPQDQSYEWNSVNVMVCRDVTKETSKIQDSPVTVRSNNRVVPRHVTQQTRKIQDSQVTFGSSNKNQVLHQTKQSPQSYSTEHIINSCQDSTVRFQLPETKQSPAYSNVPKKKIKIIVLQYSDECKAAKNQIQVDVSLTDHVKVLRNGFAENQWRGHLKLKIPKEGYYFATRQKVLNEDESFEWNGFTSPVDRVWMVPRRVTQRSWLLTHSSLD